MAQVFPERGTTPEQDRQIERMVVQGLTHPVIARRVGTTLALVDKRAAAFKRTVAVALPKSVRSNAIPRETVAMIEEEIAAGRSAKAIAESLRMKPLTVAAVARRWRKRNGIAAPRAWKGSPRPSAELLALIDQRVSEAEIIRRLGVTAWKVEHARAFHAEQHPDELCGCGRPLRHGGSCPARMPTPHNRIGPEMIARIASWTEQGYAAKRIGARLGISRACVDENRYELLQRLRDRRALCPCGRVIGHKAQCEQRRTDPPADEPVAVSAAKLLAVIRRHVPRTLDPALRDDIVSEVYLAVLQGTLAEAEIAKAAPGFISRAFATWADKFRSRSMDAPLGADDSRTLGDTFEDGTGAELLDEVELGQDW